LYASLQYAAGVLKEVEMVIIESSIFTKLIKTLMDDDEYRELQEMLIQRPDAGALIKDSGDSAEKNGKGVE
jgi:hypothetical protein